MTALIPVQTTFRHLSASPSVTARVHAEAQKLRRYFDAIKHCHVVIVAPHAHRRLGRAFAMRVEVAVPGGLVVVDHEPLDERISASRKADKPLKHDAPDQDIYVVIREVFDAVRRRLEDHARLRRGDVKQHRAADALEE